MSTLRSFPVQVEVWGWDEAFVAASGADPGLLAAQIKETVAAQTGLSCAVGIGDNKLRAKLATGFAKPGGVYRLTADNWNEVMSDRPTLDLWGIGRKTAQKLHGMGISTVADVAATDDAVLAAAFGPTTGPWIGRLGRGEGDTCLRTEPRVARGHSKSKTFAVDLTDRSEIVFRTGELAQAVAEEVVVDGRRIRRVAVTVRTASFFTRTRITTLPEVTVDADVVRHAAVKLLDRFELDRPIRLLGVRVELAP